MTLFMAPRWPQRRLFDSMFCIIVMLEKSFWLKKEVLSQDYRTWLHALVHQCEEKQLQHMFPPPCFTVGMVLFRLCWASSDHSTIFLFIAIDLLLLPLSHSFPFIFFLLSSCLRCSFPLRLLSSVSSTLLSSSSLPAASIISIKHWGDGHLLDMSVDLHIQ